ncbi:MAG: MarR family winged helix-turn-helix transcriptional regulator [Qingshengfaniella sp.]
MMMHAGHPMRGAGHVAGDAIMCEFIGYMLKRAYLGPHQAASALLQDHGLKVRSFSVLSVVFSNPGISSSELAKVLRMERSNLVPILDLLETRGLIERTRMTTDRRRYAITTTARGRRLRDIAARALRKQDDHLLVRLSAEERAQLFCLLAKIVPG